MRLRAKGALRGNVLLAVALAVQVVVIDFCLLAKENLIREDARVIRYVGMDGEARRGRRRDWLVKKKSAMPFFVLLSALLSLTQTTRPEILLLVLSRFAAKKKSQGKNVASRQSCLPPQHKLAHTLISQNFFIFAAQSAKSRSAKPIFFPPWFTSVKVFRSGNIHNYLFDW